MIKVKIKHTDKKKKSTNSDHTIKDSDQTYYREELEETIEVSEDRLYELAKEIKSLEDQIKQKRIYLSKIMKKIDTAKCKKPSQLELFNYCNNLISVSKGKLGDK